MSRYFPQQLGLVEYLYLTEAAQLLGLPKHTLRMWEAKGFVKYARDPKGFRVVHYEDLDRLKEHCNEA